jgi:Membrane domain of glycerophosphoryl diester phosphodiesterase
MGLAADATWPLGAVVTDQMPPGWENQAPPGPYGQPGYQPFGQSGMPGGQPGPPRYPQPGYGQGGYVPPGPGGWNVAPAPGGVPLRPLSLSDILNGAVTLTRRNPAATFGLAAIVMTIYGVASTVVEGIYRTRLSTDESTLRNSQSLTSQQLDHATGSAFAAIGVILLVTVVLSLVLNAALTGMLSAVVGRGVLGRTTSLGEAWRMGRVGAVLGATVLLALLGIAVLVPVVVAVVVLALLHLAPVAIALGILGWIGSVAFEVMLVIRLSLTLPVVVLERLSPVAAIKRSWQLSHGSFWRLFGILLLTWIIVFVAAAVLTIPFTLVGGLVGGGSGSLLTTAATTSVTALIIGAIGTILAATVTRPISAGVNVLLYVDLRMRREGLDLTLRDAAQNQSLTGDEFAALWRPPMAGPGTPSTW